MIKKTAKKVTTKRGKNKPVSTFEKIMADPKRAEQFNDAYLKFLLREILGELLVLNSR